MRTLKYNATTKELDQVAFFFAQFFISSVTILRGTYILISDFLHSVQLLRWRVEDFTLNLVSRDFDKSVILTTGFAADGGKIGFLCGDDEGNLQVFQENPR
jgi:hypothetical protein